MKAGALTALFQALRWQISTSNWRLTGCTASFDYYSSGGRGVFSQQNNTRLQGHYWTTNPASSTIDCC